MKLRRPCLVGPIGHREYSRFYPNHSGGPERSAKFRFTFLKVCQGRAMQGMEEGEMGDGRIAGAGPQETH